MHQCYVLHAMMLYVMVPWRLLMLGACVAEAVCVDAGVMVKDDLMRSCTSPVKALPCTTPQAHNLWNGTLQVAPS